MSNKSAFLTKKKEKAVLLFPRKGSSFTKKILLAY